MLDRRAFLGRLGALGASAMLARALPAQDAQTPQTMTGPMDDDSYRRVTLPAKPGGRPLLDAKQRDSLEHLLKCQCTCPLDVYTCRTTDFACPVSPSMHRDVMALIEGGHDEKEILAAFESVYGERVFTAPKREGFNLLGYLVPFVAIGGGGAAAALVIRRWMRTAERPVGPTRVDPVRATDSEMRRLDEAMRRDDE